MYVCIASTFVWNHFLFKKMKMWSEAYFFHLKTFSSKDLTHYKYILQVLGRKFWIQCPLTQDDMEC